MFVCVYLKSASSPTEREMAAIFLLSIASAKRYSILKDHYQLWKLISYKKWNADSFRCHTCPESPCQFLCFYIFSFLFQTNIGLSCVAAWKSHTNRVNWLTALYKGNIETEMLTHGHQVHILKKWRNIFFLESLSAILSGVWNNR